ncbi:thioesterase [Arthrobacter sp. Soil736]|nr:thioesterase [Arthrobacter sp. Soil736]
MTGASVAETDRLAGEGTATSCSVSLADGKGAGLVVSLTGASLVGMMDNFTPARSADEARFKDELVDAGIPEHLHDWLGEFGVGALVVKMGIRFLEMSPERTVATMPVEGNTQVAGILHGGAHVVLAETLGSFAAGMHAGPGRQALGIEVGATHHRAIAAGTVTGTCTAIHLGRTLATHEIVITDEQGRRLSTARITNLIRDISA